MTMRRLRGAKAGTGDPALIKLLGRDWRLWAALPADAKALAVLSDPADRSSVVALVARPTFPSGVCRRCGCTWTDPCPEGCAWTDASERLCTACVDR